MKWPFMNFQPDLILEVTSICDRRCKGCYAPNAVSQEDAETLFNSNPSFFLQTEKLKKTLEGLSQNKISSISLRGGEPSRHPKLGELLEVIRSFNASDIFVETHGRWILEESESTSQLIQACKDTNCILKISFDQMHGLKPEKLKAILDRITSAKIQYAVAITESTNEKFVVSRGFCDWVPNDKIIYQAKAVNSQDLLQPRVGVIGVNGYLVKNLTSNLRSDAQNIEVAV